MKTVLGMFCVKLEHQSAGAVALFGSLCVAQESPSSRNAFFCPGFTNVLSSLLCISFNKSVDLNNQFIV